MKPWFSRELAKLIFFYTTIVTIIVGVAAVIMAIWDIGDAFRNRLLATWFSLAAGTWLICLTNWCFHSVEESERTRRDAPSSGETPLGRALHKAKDRRSLEK